MFRKKKDTNIDMKHQNQLETTVNLDNQSSKQNKYINAHISTQQMRSKKTNVLEVFVEDTLNRFTNGDLEVQESSLEITYNRIHSEKFSKQVFQIIEFSNGINIGYLDDIKAMLRGDLPSSDKNLIDVYCTSYSKSNQQQLASRKIRGTEKAANKHLHTLYERKEEMQNPLKGVSPFLQAEAERDPRVRSSIEARKASRDEIEGINKKIEIQKKKIMSFDVVQNYQSNGGQCVDLYLFIELVSPDKNILSRCSDKLREYFIRNSIIYREILSLDQYQKTFGIASLQPKVKKKGFNVVPFLTTSNIVCSDLGFKPGIIRTKNCEVFCGNNVENGYRFDISFTESGGAENYLVVGGTGSGKSVSVACMLATWMDNPYANILIRDYKGGEWSVFANLFGNNSDIVKMDIDSSRFINPFKIPDYKVLGFNRPEAAYTLSSTFATKMLYSLIASDRVDNRQLLLNICNSIVTKVFMNNGVISDSYITYQKSKHINFRDDIWVALNDLLQDKETVVGYGTKILMEVKKALIPYFDVKGTRRYLFETEIDLNTLLQKRVVVFDYNTQGASGKIATLPSELTCRMLQESYVETIYCALRKQQRQFTIVLTEELQEQLKDDLLLDVLQTAWTVGRSGNRINIAILNSLQEFMKSQDSRVSAIRTNTQGYIIGKCDSETHNLLETSLKIDNLKYSLQKVSEGRGIYNHSFLWYHKDHKFDSVVAKYPLNDVLITSILPSKTRIKSKEDYNF